MGIRNLLFIHGKNDVSLNSTNSVSRLIAQHAQKLACNHKEVHLISLNEAIVNGVLCMKVKSKSKLLSTLEYLYNRHIKYTFSGSSVHPSNLRKLLKAYHPQQWVIIVSRFEEYNLLCSIGNVLPVVLWTHSFLAGKQLEHAIYSKPPAAWVFPTLNLFKKFQFQLAEKGIWSSCHIISYFRDLELGVPVFEENSGKENESVNFLYLGGNNARKGLKKVVDALKLLSVNYSIKLYALGFNESKIEIINEHIELHYQVKQDRNGLKQFLYKCDVGLVPSTWFENSPTALIEMATFGLFVLASNTGGIPNIIHQAGKLVDDFDFPMAWKEAMEETILNIPEIRHGRAERASNYQLNYSGDVILKNWEDVFKCIDHAEMPK